MDCSWESDDSVTFVDIDESVVKKEADVVLESFHNAICDSKGVVPKTENAKPEQIDAKPPKEIKYPSRALLTDANRKLNTRKLPLLLNGSYFTVIQTDLVTGPNRNSRGMLAECNFCESGKLIRGTMNITSNFLSHLRKRHPSQYEKYLKDRRVIRKRPSVIPMPSAKASPSSTTTSSAISEFKETECRFDEKVLTFLIENALPLSIVQTPSFLNLFEGTKLVVHPAPVYNHILNTRHAKIVDQLKSVLSNVSYFCMTLNVWLFKGQFVFGYTCHWINSVFCRKSAVLGLRSFPIDSAFQQIQEFIEHTNNEMGISEDRIVSTITNSDDDVVNSFKEYGLNDFYDIGADQEDQEQAQSVSDLSEFEEKLPSHSECVIQNLFSLVTTDFTELLKLNDSLFQLHKDAFKRCSDIWTKCTSPQKCEMIKSFVLFPLIFPTSTDWTTLYESIRSMLNYKNKLDNLCIFLETQPFMPAEIDYLEEYCQLMEPIASALKFLQTESQMLYGYFLPTLVTIKVKLHKLDNTSFKYLSFAVEQMGNKLFQRFQNFYEMQPECVEAVVAAVSCPVIKFKFVKALNQIVPKVTTESVWSCFINYAREFKTHVMENSGSRSLRSSALKETSIDESFFDFEQTTKPIVKEAFDPLTQINREINRYLADEDCSLSSLDRYPVVKKIFFKYNTPLPSYASVRRLFAYSGLTSCRRNLRMSGRHFERLVFTEAFDTSLTK